MKNTVKIIKAIIAEWAKDHQQDCNEAGLSVAKSLLEDNPLYKKPQQGNDEKSEPNGKYNKEIIIKYSDKTHDSNVKFEEGADIGEVTSVMLCNIIFLLAKHLQKPPYEVEAKISADLALHAFEHEKQYGFLFKKG